MSKDHRLSMRVPSELRLALDQMAKADRRTLASYVEGVLMQHIASKRLSTRIEEHVASNNLAARPARPHPKP